MYEHIAVYMYIHTYMYWKFPYANMFSNIYIYIHTWVCPYLHMHIYMCIYIYMYSYIRRYIHGKSKNNNLHSSSNVHVHVHSKNWHIHKFQYQNVNLFSSANVSWYLFKNSKISLMSFILPSNLIGFFCPGLTTKIEGNLVTLNRPVTPCYMYVCVYTYTYISYKWSYRHAASGFPIYGYTHAQAHVYILLCIMHGWITRHTLLKLRYIRATTWAHFICVQFFWAQTPPPSPLCGYLQGVCVFVCVCVCVDMLL